MMKHGFYMLLMYSFFDCVWFYWYHQNVCKNNVVFSGCVFVPISSSICQFEHKLASCCYIKDLKLEIMGGKWFLVTVLYLLCLHAHDILWLSRSFPQSRAYWCQVCVVKNGMMQVICDCNFHVL